MLPISGWYKLCVLLSNNYIHNNVTYSSNCFYCGQMRKILDTSILTKVYCEYQKVTECGQQASPTDDLGNGVNRNCEVPEPCEAFDIMSTVLLSKCLISALFIICQITTFSQSTPTSLSVAVVLFISLKS